MKVPFNYLPYEFQSNKKIFLQWNKLIKTSDFTLGSKMIEFEKKFAKYLGAKFCISTNNGTDALILSLKSLGVKRGDEVITVNNTFYATAGAIVAVGAKPVLIDCDSRFQMDYKLIQKHINKKTKVILPVHWGGASPNMEKIVQIANKNKLHIVEDACMAIGAKYKLKKPGNFGIVNAFSMHPLKSLNVMGDGGMIATNNKKIYQWLLKYRNHGMVDRDHIDIWGVNARLQPLQAVVALEGLKKLSKVIKTRNKNALFLDNNLKSLNPMIVLPERKNYNLETFSLYMILVERRDKLKKFLEKKGIETKIHYPIPLHAQKAAKNFARFDEKYLKNSIDQSRKLLTLPVHQYLSIDQLKYMVKTIKNFYI